MISQEGYQRFSVRYEKQDLKYLHFSPQMSEQAEEKKKKEEVIVNMSTECNERIRLNVEKPLYRK